MRNMLFLAVLLMVAGCATVSQSDTTGPAENPATHHCGEFLELTGDYVCSHGGAEELRVVTVGDGCRLWATTKDGSRSARAVVKGGKVLVMTGVVIEGRLAYMVCEKGGK